MFDGIGSFLGSIFAPALSFVGGLFGQSKTDDRQADQQQFNASQAAATRSWQEELSNTAYQRATRDMRLAGINPILAADRGGASTPSGATASTSTHPAGDIVTPAINSAMGVTRLSQELKNMKEQANRNQNE